jgi:ABC-type antimicrobial peptide transport system permease subunit
MSIPGGGSLGGGTSSIRLVFRLNAFMVGIIAGFVGRCTAFFTLALALAKTFKWQDASADSNTLFHLFAQRMDSLFLNKKPAFLRVFCKTV